MLGSALGGTVPRMRAQAESMMTDTCTIARLTTVWNEALQKSETTWAPIHTSLTCWVEVPSVNAQALLTAEVVTPETPTVHLPVDTTDVEPDDRVTVTAVGPVSDPGLVDAVLWVTHSLAQTFAVERLLVCRWTR